MRAVRYACRTGVRNSSSEVWAGRKLYDIRESPTVGASEFRSQEIVCRLSGTVYWA